MYLHGQVPTVNTREESGVLMRPFVIVENRPEFATIPQTQPAKVKVRKQCKLIAPTARTNSVIKDTILPNLKFRLIYIYIHIYIYIADETICNGRK